MSYVGNYRAGLEYTENEIGFWNLFLDLFICNRNLYEEYDYVQNSGILYGSVFLGPILAVIPFAQSVFCSITNVPPYLLTSA